MLSEKTVKLIEQYMAMGYAIRKQIEAETDGVFGLCLIDHIQLHDNLTYEGRVYDLKEVEDLVGPIEHIYTLDDGRKGYSYRLGKVEGVIIMDINSTDSRAKANGGADDDVQANPST